MAKISFYFDEMLNRPLARELIKRGFEVVMAVDVGMTKKKDDEHLAVATQRGMVLVTQDRGFAGRTMNVSNHAGVICWTPTDQPVGDMLRALREFAEKHSPEDAAGRVFWLK